MQIQKYLFYITNFFSKFNYQIPITFGLYSVYKDYEKIYGKKKTII